MQELIRSDHQDIQEQTAETDVMNLSKHGTARPDRDKKLLRADARHELTKLALTTSATATETLNLHAALEKQDSRNVHRDENDTRKKAATKPRCWREHQSKLP